MSTRGVLLQSHLGRRSERQCWLTLCALGASCASESEASEPEPSFVLEYHTTELGRMQSTLHLAPTRQRISAVTHLADGGSLTETVHFDGSGRVLDATISFAAPIASQSREVVLDAASGQVEVTTPSFHKHWRAPNDLPWVWTSLLSQPGSSAAVSTPLHAMVVQRAAAAGDALRWLDISTYQSHSVMTDQVLIPEGDSSTVVLGDDWADLSDGVPVRMHLAAPSTDLEADDPQLLSATLAACDVSPSSMRRLRGC